MAALWAAQEPLRILCTRQFQNSIKESFHAELRIAIESEPWLAKRFDIGVDYLRGKNGSEFFFKGLDRHIGSIKSLSRIDLAIVEEAEDVKEDAWQALLPTIREPKSEIWAIWNPKKDTSPVHTRFRISPPSNGVFAEMNWRDNPFFPDVLNEQRLEEKRLYPPQIYDHVWEGKLLLGSLNAVYKEEWFKTYTSIPDYTMRIVHSWDTAAKEKEHNDPSACTIWKIRDETNEAFLVDVINERMEYPKLKRKVIAMAEKYPPDAILIEDAQTGIPLTQELKMQTNLPVIPIQVKPKEGKVTRAVASAGTVEAGRISIPAVAPWKAEYLRQVLYYPSDDEEMHDDMVDSTSQFINWWKAEDKGKQYQSLLSELYGVS